MLEIRARSSFLLCFRLALVPVELIPGQSSGEKNGFVVSYCSLHCNVAPRHEQVGELHEGGRTLCYLSARAVFVFLVICWFSSHLRPPASKKQRKLSKYVAFFQIYFRYAPILKCRLSASRELLLQTIGNSQPPPRLATSVLNSNGDSVLACICHKQCLRHCPLDFSSFIPRPSKTATTAAAVLLMEVVPQGRVLARDDNGVLGGHHTSRRTSIGRLDPCSR